MAKSAKGESAPKKKGDKIEGGKGASLKPGGNVTDEIIAHHLKLILPLKANLDKAREAQQTANGAYRAALKAAKGDNIQPDAITDAIKLKEGDSGEIRLKSELTRRVLKVLGSPMADLFAEQMDLFADKAPAVPEGDTLDACHAQGEEACRAGQTANANPYPAGSEQWKAWDTGFHAEFEYRVANGQPSTAAEPVH